MKIVEMFSCMFERIPWSMCRLGIHIVCLLGNILPSSLTGQQAAHKMLVLVLVFRHN